MLFFYEVKDIWEQIIFEKKVAAYLPKLETMMDYFYTNLDLDK